MGPERETMTGWGEERRENKEGQIGGEGKRAEKKEHERNYIERLEIECRGDES